MENANVLFSEVFKLYLPLRRRSYVVVKPMIILTGDSRSMDGFVSLYRKASKNLMVSNIYCM